MGLGDCNQLPNFEPQLRISLPPSTSWHPKGCHPAGRVGGTMAHPGDAGFFPKTNRIDGLREVNLPGQKGLEVLTHSLTADELVEVM